MHNSPLGWPSKAGLLACASSNRGCLPGYSPVALCVPAVVLCAYSYGVVADSHRASRHLAVRGWLQAERLSSRMKLFCEVLQCIDRHRAGEVDPVVQIVGAMRLDRRHAAPAWTVL